MRLERLLVALQTLRHSCLGLLAIASYTPCNQALAAERPNVILIICDDLNDYVEGFGGHPQAKPPLMVVWCRIKNETVPYSGVAVVRNRRDAIVAFRADRDLVGLTKISVGIRQRNGSLVETEAEPFTGVARTQVIKVNSKDIELCLSEMESQPPKKQAACTIVSLDIPESGATAEIAVVETDAKIEPLIGGNDGVIDRFAVAGNLPEKSNQAMIFDSRVKLIGLAGRVNAEANTLTAGTSKQVLRELATAKIVTATVEKSVVSDQDVVFDIEGKK